MDGAPKLIHGMFKMAKFLIDGKVIRLATDYLGFNGVVRGDPARST